MTTTPPKPFFDPDAYVVRQIKDPRDLHAVIDLEQQVFAGTDICAPDSVIRDRFDAYPGAFVIYNIPDAQRPAVDNVRQQSTEPDYTLLTPVGMRTYAPIDYKKLTDDLAAVKKVFPIIDASYLTTSSEHFWLLSIAVLPEHRRHALKARFEEKTIKFSPSRQLLHAAFLEAETLGAQHICGCTATQLVLELYTNKKKLDFEIKRPVVVNGDNWQLICYDIGDTKTDRSKLETLLAKLKIS